MRDQPLNPPANEAHRKALMAMSIAREHLGVGEDEIAEEAFVVAQEHYETAGIDPAWFDPTLTKVVPVTPELFLLPDGRVEISDNPDPLAPVTGITAEPSALVEVER